MTLSTQSVPGVSLTGVAVIMIAAALASMSLKRVVSNE
jgi:hypothetical protein